jgi:hypothetical protein
MHLNEHSDLRGKHALFSPSQPSFFNCDPKDFIARLINKYRAQLGTDIHEWASVRIKRCHKITSTKEMLNAIDEFIFNKYYIEKTDSVSKDGQRILQCLKQTIKAQPELLENIRLYVNDAIGFKMYTEVVLYFTDEFYGTSDAVIFNDKDKLLRIHDLKTGSSVVHIEQLLGYAALFCLEQRIDPLTIDYELRIYQGNDILVATPSGEDVKPFVDQYIAFDKAINKYEGGF